MKAVFLQVVAGLVCAGLGVSVALAAPRRVEVEKRSGDFSTETEKAVLPEQVPMERNEVLMNKRFETSTVTRKEATVGGRRSAIEMKEGRDKKLFRTPEQKKFETIERKESAWSGKKSRFSTSEDAYRSKVATRFQDKIGEASPFAGDVKPVVSQRTTFDRVNRFVFRRGGEDEPTTVTTAGGGAAPAEMPDAGAREGGAATGIGSGAAEGAAADNAKR